ncbi:winged helix-turn-helix domain-containing protein [Streptomyces anulatus]
MSDQQFAQLEAELAKGPAAHGWEDQRWPLAWVKTGIGRRFHLTYSIQGVRKLLARNGWPCQVPARRAMGPDDNAVAGWGKEVWPCAEGSRRPVEPGSSSKTKPASPGRRRTQRRTTDPTPRRARWATGLSSPAETVCPKR